MNIEDLISLMNRKGYEVFVSATYPYDVNIVGVRSRNSRVNYFDDTLYLFYKSKGQWIARSWTITTLPGLTSLLKPESPNGTAILVPGQYKQAYELGLHRGKYVALVQVGKVKVYRDIDLDSYFDLDPATIEEGYFGINIHKAGLLAQLVGPNSAGCQVFQKSADYDEFIDICRQGAAKWGNKFTYTLIEA